MEQPDIAQPASDQHQELRRPWQTPQMEVVDIPKLTEANMYPGNDGAGASSFS